MTESGEAPLPLPQLPRLHAARQLEGTFGSATIDYQATAATEHFDIDGRPVAFFHVSYTAVDIDPASRPLLFCFNGGPGSSTVWLHMGMFGPRRMQLDDDGFKIATQGKLVDNEHSILDATDIVCVDALGTGFSRVGGDDPNHFNHFGRDLDAFARFIAHYLTRYGRWGSPKYLAGESYGTLRAAGLARVLYDGHHVELNGIVLLSTILNTQTSAIDPATMLVHPGNDLPFPVLLPSFAAAAHYHGALSPERNAQPLAELVAEVVDFALGDYWSALARGDRLDGDRRASIVARLRDYTGLDLALIERSNLRVQVVQFCRELLATTGRTVGRLDARITGHQRIGASISLEADPSGDDSRAVAASALNQYLRDELGLETDEPYELLALEVWKSWDYEGFVGRYVDTSNDLRDVLARSVGTELFVASGYYDLATPLLGADYSLDHLGLPASVRKKIHTEYYEGGHMMYLHQPSLARLAGDLRTFIARTGPTAGM